MSLVAKDLLPDPFNDVFATDKEGRLYRHTVMEIDGRHVDIGYTLEKKEG